MTAPLTPDAALKNLGRALVSMAHCPYGENGAYYSHCNPQKKQVRCVYYWLEYDDPEPPRTMPLWKVKALLLEPLMEERRKRVNHARFGTAGRVDFSDLNTAIHLVQRATALIDEEERR